MRNSRLRTNRRPCLRCCRSVPMQQPPLSFHSRWQLSRNG